MRVKRARDGEVAFLGCSDVSLWSGSPPLIANGYQHYGLTEHHVIQPRCLSDSIGENGNGSSIGKSSPPTEGLIWAPSLLRGCIAKE